VRVNMSPKTGTIRLLALMYLIKTISQMRTVKSELDAIQLHDI